MDFRSERNRGYFEKSGGRSLAVIGGPSTYYVGGSLNDGKGQPGQSNAVSHECPTSVFRGFNVLNTGR